LDDEFNPWPSFFGHLFDDFFKQGGGYFGAKKALRPINVVWDYYATGDRSTAKLYVVNQTSESRNGLLVSLEFLEGRRKFFKEVKDFSIGPNTSAGAMTVGRVAGLPSTYLVRATLRNADNTVLAENVYWGSTTDDDLGEAKNDEQFKTSLVQWADMSALNAMPRADVAVSSSFSQRNGEGFVKITLKNSSSHVAFFLRAEVTKGTDVEEILPIVYDDNYMSVFPHESRTITATFRTSELAGRQPALRLEGYNVGKRVLPLEPQ
jgi:exo-1,4-beta-D-glucosaminidase